LKAWVLVGFWNLIMSNVVEGLATSSDPDVRQSYSLDWPSYVPVPIPVGPILRRTKATPKIPR
jgi:hypothetical protein